MRLVTQCPDHGTKVTETESSARLYRRAASVCHEAHMTDSQHAIAHAVEGTDCWSCCERMRVAPPYASAG